MIRGEPGTNEWTSTEFVMSIGEEVLIDDMTFSEPARILRLTSAAEEHLPILTVPIRTGVLASTDVLRAVATLARARDPRGLAAPSVTPLSTEERVAVARAGITRHGWARVWIDSQEYSTPFVDDWGFAALFAEDADRPTVEELRDVQLSADQLPPTPREFRTRRVKASIHMKESWVPWKGGWPFSGTLGNLAALLDPFTHQGVDDIKELIHLLWVDAGAYSAGQDVACISELRIHSHGNKSEILMGDNKIKSGDFESSGVVRPNTDTETLIKALKKLMCRPSKIIFDACSAAEGTLLQNISKNLGPDITVNGFSGVGLPVTEGDTNYVNGVKVP